MRVVLDTNILVSSLIVPDSPPHRIYEAWRAGAFVLATSDEQLEEFRRVTRYDKLRPYIDPATAGTLHNELRKIAQHVGRLPKVKRSPDAADDYLLALAQTASADYLVTGDKSGLLALKRHASKTGDRPPFLLRQSGVDEVINPKKRGLSLLLPVLFFVPGFRFYFLQS